MRAYHIDRDNTLQEGQIISLYKNNESSFLENTIFPDGLSYHGLHYLDESFQNLCGNQPSFYVLEYELELIRKSYFPNLPSRFQSFFAIESIEENKKWDGIFSDDCTIWEIEFDESNCIIRDSNLLQPTLKTENSNIVFSPKDSFLYGYHYWSGYNTTNPRMELLIKPPIKIIKKVQLE